MGKMDNHISMIRRMAGLILFLACMVSCGSVHRFTRVKKIPREFTLNYCAGEIKAPRGNTTYRKGAWIVFSDKTDNLSYQSATGKNEMKEMDYLDAFLVIGRKGDWLKLIKYDPAILQNGKLTQWKQAKYYGWVHKNDLLLTQSSITDLRTGLKNKMLTLLSDTVTLENPSHYFNRDSLYLFKDADLVHVAGKVPLHSIVYPMKKSENGGSMLIAKKNYADADSIGSDILGWIDRSLLAPSGQQLHIGIQQMRKGHYLHFKDRRTQDTLSIDAEFDSKSKFISDRYPALTYNPVTSYSQTDTGICLQTQVRLPVIDRSDSYVLNVNGNPIYYSRFEALEKELSKINIVFVMEGQEGTIAHFPAIVNVIQGLQPVLANDETYSFRYGAVLTFNERNNPQHPVLPLTDNYMEVLDFLSRKSQNTEKLEPVYGIRGSWSGLRNAVDMFNDCPEESNLLIVVGDKGYNSEWADSTLVNRMVHNNCRILGFQLYGGAPDNFNNFVLQLGNMIDNYAPKKSKKKREVIVYADQLRSINEYRETARKNTFCLDFPTRSMTQGWLIFPQKNEVQELEGLSSSIDSLLGQVKFDNSLLVHSLYKAFDEVGYYRHNPDTAFLKYHHLNRSAAKRLVETIKNSPLHWSLPAQPVIVPDSLSGKLDYHLLLTENEFKTLREFINKLSAYEVDYKFQVEKKKKNKRKFCDCPDDLTVAETKGSIANDSLGMPEYASTRKIRYHLVLHYLKYVNRDKYCRLTHKESMRMPLSEMHLRITSCPTEKPFLEAYRLKDIKRKKRMPDEVLDKLIQDFKATKKELDKAAGNSFRSNGQTYYWIARRLIP